MSGRVAQLMAQSAVAENGEHPIAGKLVPALPQRFQYHVHALLMP
jgi:hypothetical protein